MTQSNTGDLTDTYDFLRQRAASLWKEGQVEQGLQVLEEINKEQIRLITRLLRQESKAAQDG